MLVIMVFHLILKDHIVILSLVLDYHVHIIMMLDLAAAVFFFHFQSLT